MNKHQLVAKKNIKTAVMAAIVVVVCGATYGGAAFFASTIEQKKAETESKADQDKALLSNLRNQVDQSGHASKRFAEILSARNNSNFAGTKENLSEYLRNAKVRHRFDKMDLRLAKEASTEKPELLNFNYTTMLRPRVSVKFQAMSDTHVFSFIDDLQRSAPGLIRIDRVMIRRLAEMSDSVIAQIPNGVAPLLVEAEIEFTWINFVPKDKDKKPTTPPPAP